MENLPPSPQFWGSKKIKFFQSPPELGDLGGLDKSQRRQLDLCVHGSLPRGEKGTRDVLGFSRQLR
jgi:hypothetical protein